MQQIVTMKEREKRKVQEIKDGKTKGWLLTQFSAVDGYDRSTLSFFTLSVSLSLSLSFLSYSFTIFRNPERQIMNELRQRRDSGDDFLDQEATS